MDLNGRFFNKRKIRATFFKADRFERGDLAPGPDED